MFLANYSQLIEPPKDKSEDETSVASEKEMLRAKITEMSAPQFSSTISERVAIKVFAMTPNLPMRLIPARVITQLELSTVLNHPNIVRFVETFATKKDIFMVMRLVVCMFCSYTYSK